MITIKFSETSDDLSRGQSIGTYVNMSLSLYLSIAIRCRKRVSNVPSKISHTSGEADEWEAGGEVLRLWRMVLRLMSSDSRECVFAGVFAGVFAVLDDLAFRSKVGEKVGE